VTTADAPRAAAVAPTMVQCFQRVIALLLD
jgi:hypothetical protein